MEDPGLDEREVAKWLPRADARRARLVCRAWRGSLAALSTSATTPPEASTVTRWRAQLDTMLASLPCLRELTVGSRLSDVGAQQLSVLAGAGQLRVLRIPHGHALRDRSIQAVAQLTQLHELQILGANALSDRALCTLSMLGANLRVLDLRGCSKVSWAELREAWRAVCSAYLAAAHARTRRAPRSSGGSGVDAISGGGLRSSSGGGGGSSGGGSGGGGGASLQQLLPGGAEVLQRQRAGLGRSPRASTARDRLLLSRTTRASSASSGGSSSGGRSSDGGASSRGGGGGARFAPRRPGGSRNVSTGSGGKPCSADSSRDNSAGGAAGEGAPDAPGGAGGGAGGWSVKSGRGGSGGGDGGDGGGEGSASAGQQSPIFSGRSMRLPRAAALKLGSRVPRRPSSGGALVAAAQLQSRTLGSIFKQPVVQQQPQSPQQPQPQPQQQQQRPHQARQSAEAQPPQRQTAPAPAPARQQQPPTLAAAFARVTARQARAPASPPAAAALGVLGAFGRGAAVQKQRSTVQAALLALLRAEERRISGRRLRSSLGGTPDGATADATGPAALPMPFPHLHTLAFSFGGGGGGGEGGGSFTGGAALAAELAAVASIASLTSLDIARCQQVSDAALSQLSALTQLSSLRLSGLWSVGDAGLSALSALTGLTSLSLHSPLRATAPGLRPLAALSRLEALSLCVPQDTGPGAAAALALKLPRLRSLEVGSPGFTDACCEALAEDAAKRASLTSLRLHDAPALTARGAAALRAAPALAQLSIDACCGVGVGALLGQGLLPPALRGLSLRSQAFANMFAGGVLERPACGGTLVALDLAGCADLVDRELRKVVGFLPALQELTLTGCACVTDAGLSALSSLRRLRALSAGGTRAAGAFAEALAPLDGLSSLSLRGCGALTAAAARGQLPLLAGLRDLDLSDCRCVDDATVLVLAGALTALGRLNVQGCKGVTRGVLPFVPHWLRLQHSLG
ncbi:hypothetical protein Rsub_12671 [Raphidocelis subcapitata]|uniref:F-box domain-containing protein n=1 Tax=Raphidocelis subcapitata TaxID=307507 RepID=A0A2V0PRH1_9CHLO|nr:hypothetical protein Rsub_12671 [Raphidocelis subcapitata]|eukprot:GBF99875.1 hypothetical protein Rsub_12671 [Raphidocelis subcapitata]